MNRASRGRGDGGVTLVEVVVALALLTVVLATAFQVLTGVLTIDRRQDRSTWARRDLQQAVRELERDLRSAVTVHATVAAGAAAGTLELTVTEPAGEAVVRWTVTSGSLVRQRLSGAGGAVTATRTVLRSYVQPAATTLFGYLDATGTVLDPPTTGMATLSRCVQRVRVTLGVELPGGGGASETTDLALRGRPADLSCNGLDVSTIGEGYAAAVGALAPVGWWRLDETTGTVAANAGSAGSAADGTWGASAARATGVVPGTVALAATGTAALTHGVDLGTPAALAGTLASGVTVSAWVWPEPAVGSPATVVRKGTGPFTGFSLSVVDGAAQGAVRVGTTTFTAQGGSVPLRRWSLITVTHSAGTLRLYVNGVEVASTAAAGTIDLGVAAGNPTAIGATADGTAPMLGRVDEVAFWQRALSASEVVALWRAAS